MVMGKKILVLLGPSGSGKTTYCEYYGSLRFYYDVGNAYMLLSTGCRLRRQNLLSAWREPDMSKIKECCRKLIDETLTYFKESTNQLLVVDCVKDLEDAEYVAVQASKHGLEVTRALLFKITPRNLRENWIFRGEDRDMLRGPARAYLNYWSEKSNDLVNYYRKLQLLSFYEFAGDVYYDDITQEFPLLASPNYVSYLLIDSVKIRYVFAKLHSLLKINQFQFALPASFVHCYRDVTWVTDPTRYHVTAKTDGVRCLLLKIQDGTYFINRKNEIYPCHIVDDQLPYNTVLDGELSLPSKSVTEIHPNNGAPLTSSVFLVFDVLADAGDVLWTWPFSVRLENLSKLPISKNIAAVMKRGSRVNETNLNEIVVSCAVKEHMKSTSAEVLNHLSFLSQLPYPCDGLVFTPNKAYVFGPDPLLFKWQSEHSVHCDILKGDLLSRKRKCVPIDDGSNSLSKVKRESDIFQFWFSLNDTEIIECQWNQLEKAWEPLFVRRDKPLPNSDETLDRVEKLCQQPYTVKHFITDLSRIEHVDVKLEDARNVPSVVVHPALSYSFDELYAKITELVQLGYVEKAVDSDTTLEIFNYSTSVSNPLISLCRGLVLDSDSKTIVTKPFIRFFEDMGERDPEETVEATIKYDGSLGIAFLWRGKVVLATIRRMDSEQAMWAKKWIKNHCNLTEFQAGYTYLFEIIYRDNTVVVQYPFKGLILLAISNESGHELLYEELLRCARNIGFFMVTPRITALYSEILWYCGGIDVTRQGSTTLDQPTFISGASPVNRRRQEGWVVKFKDGGRQKIVYSWWKDASKIARLVHPQIVWLLLRHDKTKEVFGNIPSNFRVEINRMIQALGRKFMETVKDVEDHLTQSGLKSNDSAESGTKVRGFWSSYVSDDSDEEDVEKTFQFRKQTKQLSLAEKNLITKDKGCVEEVEESSGKIMTNETKELVRILKPYWKVPKTRPYYSSQLFFQEKDINLAPIYNCEKGNYLRIPILDYICPKSPVLDGYEPSTNFKQTWCKGWKTLPINHSLFLQELLQDDHQLPPFLQLPVEVIVLLLKYLDGRRLATMTKVCMHLRLIVESSQLLRNRIAMAKTKEEHWLYWWDLEADMYDDYSSNSDQCGWSRYGSY